VVVVVAPVMEMSPTVHPPTVICSPSATYRQATG